MSIAITHVEYDRGMRQKTSVTLSEDLLQALAKATRKGESRSQAVERLLRETLSRETRRARDNRDLELIDRNADRLNAEAEDVLGYQVDL
jgi:metal-responsive CopG/Arc/MetJ family transcriptional regulator